MSRKGKINQKKKARRNRALFSGRSSESLGRRCRRSTSRGRPRKPGVLLPLLLPRPLLLSARAKPARETRGHPSTTRTSRSSSPSTRPRSAAAEASGALRQQRGPLRRRRQRQQQRLRQRRARLWLLRKSPTPWAGPERPTSRTLPRDARARSWPSRRKSRGAPGRSRGTTEGATPQISLLLACSGQRRRAPRPLHLPAVAAAHLESTRRS